MENSLELENLYINEWLPSSKEEPYEPKDVLLAVHGLGGHGGWFERLAQKFIEVNIPFYALDLRGFGKSKFQRGHVDSYLNWIADIKTIYLKLKEKYPRSTISILGHSMGGSLIANLIDLDPEDKIIFSVPGFKGAREKWDFWGFTLPALIKLAFTPRSYVKLPDPEEYNPTLNDPERVAETTAHLLGQILLLNNSTKKKIQAIKNPTLVVKVQGDDVICNETIDEYFKMIPSAQKETYTSATDKHDWIWYEELDSIAKEIISWIK